MTNPEFSETACDGNHFTLGVQPKPPLEVLVKRPETIIGRLSREHRFMPVARAAVLTLTEEEIPKFISELTELLTNRGILREEAQIQAAISIEEEASQTNQATYNKWADAITKFSNTNRSI